MSRHVYESSDNDSNEDNRDNISESLKKRSVLFLFHYFILD